MRHAKDIRDVKICRGADCDSDHFQVQARLRQRLTTSKKASMGKKEIKSNTEALKEEGSTERYKQMISDGLKEHDLSEVDTEERWKIIKDNA
jgi:esterase/lipase superfamily enzyme